LAWLSTPVVNISSKTFGALPGMLLALLIGYELTGFRELSAG